MYVPPLIGIGVAVSAIWTQNWTWLFAIPLGFVTMTLGSPMNPGRAVAAILGVALLAAGWLGGWLSLVVCGIVVLAVYVEMQVFYGLGKRAFRRFLISNSDGFAKYWNMGIVMLKDGNSGHVYSHDTTA